MKKYFYKIITILFIAIWIFIGLKGCVSSVYDFNETMVYENQLDKDFKIKVYITPSNKIIVKKQYKSLYEIAVFGVKGSSATHYFGSFYNLQESPFGIRYFKGAKEVWKLENTILHKEGDFEETTFGEVGEKFNSVLIVRENSIKLGNQNYNKVRLLEEDIDLLKSSFFLRD